MIFLPIPGTVYFVCSSFITSAVSFSTDVFLRSFFLILYHTWGRKNIVL